VRELLEELRRRDVSVLLNTHLLSEVEHVCDRVLILDRGAIVAAGAPADLTRARGLQVELASGTRVFEGASRDDVPRIVADLVAAGEQIYSVELLRSTLEERYLEVVQ
jgi:ABC-2 type transport system ATP-binding protein